MMIKKTLLLLVLLVATLSARADVAIDAAHFPDIYFRAYLLTEYRNGIITTAQLNSRDYLKVDSLNISDLTGVAYFSNLVGLFSDNNNLTKLPTLPSSLEVLHCDNNKLTSLSEISTCAETLEYLHCSKNNFTSMNISNMPRLRELWFEHCAELTDFTCQNNPKLQSLYIEGCTKLTSLFCPNNHLATIYIKGCTALKNVRCHNNIIRKIDNLGSCTSLTYLYCNNNYIERFDALPASLQEIDCNRNLLSTLPSLPGSLQKLYCSHNELRVLPTLPVSLKELNCSNNQIKELPTLPNSLKWLDCSDNQIKELPTLPDNIEVVICSKNFISGNVLANSRTKLTTLDMSNNPSIKLIGVDYDLALTTLGIEGCTGLKTLSMGNVPSFNFSNLTLPSALEKFSCDNNNLTALPALPESLKTLYCYNNQLTALPTLPATIETVVVEKNRFTTLKINAKTNLQNLYVGNNPLLTELNCSYNALSALDISGCTALKTLYCNNNQLASLNVQGFAALEKVLCGANQLTSLSFQGCNALSFVNCCDNQIKGSEMTAMIGSLRTMPSGTQGTLQVLTSEGDGNTINNEQVRAARNKGWIPYEWDSHKFVEIPVEDGLLGDINGDNKVDVEDVNAIINIILELKDAGNYPGNADVTGDNKVDVEDVNVVINIILES